MSQDFNKGKIYKITNDYNDDIYVGSTTQPLCKRMAAHKNKFKFKPHYKLYMKMEGRDKIIPLLSQWDYIHLL